ncbi:MAG: undecaprenyl-phosphate glucose phosphotransferase [Candidatus Omnitrophica bacterium]|nr:undecaprenyl-phosphate glucose phosphotransferase [Candidatus Omnitrophota bacterium]
MKARYRKTYYAVSLLISDIFMAMAALRSAFWLLFESGLLRISHGRPDYAMYAQAFGLVIVLLVASHRAYGLYVEERISYLSEEARLLFKAGTVTFALLLAISFFYRGFSFSRSYLPVAWAMTLLFVFTARILLGYLYMVYRRRHVKFKEILVIGANHECVRFAMDQKRKPRRCSKVVGILDDRYMGPVAYKGIPVLGRVGDLDGILSSHQNINEVVVTDGNLPHETIIRLMMISDKHLASFRWASDVFGMLAARVNMETEAGMTLLSLKESPLLEWENRILKRFFDALLSASGLLVLSPVLLALAAAVKLTSRGTCFYRQERVGEDGKRFKIVKFRTMRRDAEADSGPVWARKDDDRRTLIGKLLRRTNLDELPQLWNVLKGDMSLVGPRPERPHFVGRFKEGIPRYMARHKIKSGITGWAQVNGLRGDTSIEERTKYDLYYIENWSVFLDIKILLKTLLAFKNAY